MGISLRTSPHYFPSSQIPYSQAKMGSIPPFSSEIPKPVGSTEKLANDINRSFAMPVPAFGDLGKAANDLINKDFYHTAQGTLDVKLKAPNGTNVAVKGKQGFDGVTSGSIEGKHTLKPQGVTITQAWTTASLLDTKVELSDVVAPGAKVDLQNLWNPSKPNSAAQKLNLAWKNPNVHTRAFINYGTASGNVDATVDAVAGHEGFLVGGEAAYDVGKGAVTRYRQRCAEPERHHGLLLPEGQQLRRGRCQGWL